MINIMLDWHENSKFELFNLYSRYWDLKKEKEEGVEDEEQVNLARLSIPYQKLHLYAKLYYVRVKFIDY